VAAGSHRSPLRTDANQARPGREWSGSCKSLSPEMIEGSANNALTEKAGACAANSGRSAARRANSRRAKKESRSKEVELFCAPFSDWRTSSPSRFIGMACWPGWAAGAGEIPRGEEDCRVRERRLLLIAAPLIDWHTLLPSRSSDLRCWPGKCAGNEETLKTFGRTPMKSSLSALLVAAIAATFASAVAAMPAGDATGKSRGAYPMDCTRRGQGALRILNRNRSMQAKTDDAWPTACVSQQPPPNSHPTPSHATEQGTHHAESCEPIPARWSLQAQDHAGRAPQMHG